MIVKSIPGDFFASNCYIVASETTKRAMVIDPGVPVEWITEAAAEIDVSIALIVLTHVHRDHCVSLETIQKVTQAPLAVFDAETLSTSPEPIQLPMGLIFVPFVLPIPPDILLKDGGTITVDDLHLSVLHTPGHSQDSMCLLGEGTLFSGDTLLRRRIGINPPVFLPGQNAGQLKKSIQEKLMILPDDTVVYPGHGASTTIGEERRFNRMLYP